MHEFVYPSNFYISFIAPNWSKTYYVSDLNSKASLEKTKNTKTLKKGICGKKRKFRLRVPQRALLT